MGLQPGSKLDVERRENVLVVTMPVDPSFNPDRPSMLLPITLGPITKVAKLVEGDAKTAVLVLGHADAAILVGVDERERLLIELEAFDGAAQRDPEFLVELAEREQIVGGLERDLIKAAGAEEFPDVARGGSGVGHGGARGSARGASRAGGAVASRRARAIDVIAVPR